jgi:hypothetical protein
MAKFFSPVSCGEELIFECTETKRDNEESEIHAYVVPERKLENFFEFKESANFNHRNTWSILRIKI